MTADQLAYENDELRKELKKQKDYIQALEYEVNLCMDAFENIIKGLNPVDITIDVLTTIGRIDLLPESIAYPHATNKNPHNNNSK